MPLHEVKVKLAPHQRRSNMEGVPATRQVVPTLIVVASQATSVEQPQQ
jgi:hypothetical protein